MVEEIGGLSHGWLDRLVRSGRAKPGEAPSAGGSPPADDDEDLAVSAELRALLDRIKLAGMSRKSRVHEVLEKLARGELVTSETVREAAENILREGT